MALLAMAVFDTEENQRTEYTMRTFQSIWNTVNIREHRVFIIDNASCKETKDFLSNFKSIVTIITNEENVGTAKAINQAWKLRKPGEHCIKMDNDVVIHESGWVEQMEECIRRDRNIGQVGLKRKDCWENPEHESDFYRSKLKMLPHVAGEKWMIVEKSNHVMGTCVMHSSDLLDKVGGLVQPNLYGFDDSLMSLRSRLAGFYNCFLPHIEIDHIDTGHTDYQKWKEREAGEMMAEFHRIQEEYQTGKRSLYHEY